MQCHQAHGAGHVVELIGGCHERHFGEEVDQRALGVVLGELLGDGHEFVHVFGARLVLRVFRGAQLVEVARLLHQHLQHLGHRSSVGQGRGLIEQGAQV